MPESQKKLSNIAHGDEIPALKMSKNVHFVIFGIFKPFQEPQKWKLGQFLKYTPRNFPKDARKSKKVSNIASGDEIGCPLSVEKNSQKLKKIEENWPPSWYGWMDKNFFFTKTTPVMILITQYMENKLISSCLA